MGDIKAYGLNHSGAHACTLDLVSLYLPEEKAMTFKASWVDHDMSTVYEVAVMDGVDLLAYFTDTFIFMEDLSEYIITIAWVNDL